MIVNSSIVAFNSKTWLDEDENIGFLPGNMNSKMETSVCTANVDFVIGLTLSFNNLFSKQSR